MMITKVEARQRIKKLRLALSNDKRQAYDRAIEEHLFRLLDKYPEIKNLNIYVSTPEEADTKHIIEKALKEGMYEVAVPKVTGRDMDFYRIGSIEELKPGTMGILEPVKDRTRLFNKADEDKKRAAAVIMPGLAFTREGKRLGYGGGYYDRYLAGESLFKKIALCYSFQLLDDFEDSPHDVRVGIIVTEKGVLYT